MALLSKHVMSLYPNATLPLFNKPVSLTVTYMIPLPKCTKMTKRRLLDRTPHTKRPDLDNLDKFLNDALNEIAWVDDAQIWSKMSRKLYTREEKGFYEVKIEELDESENPQSSDLC